MKVEDLMVRDVVTTDLDDDVAAVAHKMIERAVGCVVLRDESGVSGIITDRDMLNCLSAAHDAGLCSVATHMQSPVVTISPREELVKAAELMTEHRIKRLPVVDGGALVGVLSFADIAAFLHENTERVAPDLTTLSSLIRAGASHRRLRSQ